MCIGKRIKRRREELGMTQEELARKMGYKSKTTINKVELGINGIAQSKIKEYATALETTPAILMGWEEPSEQEGYYTNPETAKLAQELHDNPDLRALLDASRDMKPEQMRNVTAVIQAMKDTNPDG